MCGVTSFAMCGSITSVVMTYMVCLKSKCTDFPMYELVALHLVDVYWRVGSDLGYMFILVSTGLVGSVVRYCCLCAVVF